MLRSGEAETVKAAYHGMLGALALGALVYNALAFRLRRQAHLAGNVALYATIVALEARKVGHHLEALRR